MVGHMGGVNGVGGMGWVIYYTDRVDVDVDGY